MDSQVQISEFVFKSLLNKQVAEFGIDNQLGILGSSDDTQTY